MVTVRYTSDDHQYGCDVPNNEITRLLVELDYPHHSERVLRYFHEELKYSTRELADLFGVARQTLQGIAYKFDDFRFSQRNGRMTAMDLEQRELGDYERAGLSKFI